MNHEEVKKIAALSRIALTDEEINQLKSQFADILNYIRQIDKVDLKGIEPVSHPFELKNVFRDDTVTEPIGADELLKISPAHDRSMITVPQIIEGKS